MSAFNLKIVTPDGLIYDGQAEKLIVRTRGGDVCILARHTDYISALGLGECRVTDDKGNVRSAACIGGMVSVLSGSVTLVPTTFEWADKIDTDRAEASYQKAQTMLQNKEATETDIRLAEARLRRALVRKSVATTK